MERRYLEFREGTSDKFYRIFAAQVAGQWMVSAQWGRRGSDGQMQVKYAGPSREQAFATVEEFYNQKRAKGYRDALDPLMPAAHSAPAPSINRLPPTLKANTISGGVSPAMIAGYNAQVGGVPRFPAMKAKEVPDFDWHGHDYVMEEKFDGHRAGLTFNPDGSIVVRNVYGEDKGRIANMPHIEAELRKLPLGLHQGTLIDGELVGLTLAQTTHLLGAGGQTDPRLRFVAFDLPFLAGRDLRNEEWHVRRERLVKLLGGAGGPVSLSTPYPAAQEIVDDIWAAGGEGAILKPIRSLYVPAGRADWIKVKEHHTADAIVTGWAPGAGKYNNQLGALKLSQYRNGVLVEVTKVSGMTDALRKHMSDNFAVWNGQVVEFEYQKKTDDSYRHPRFVRARGDKKPTDCTWETSA